MECYGRSYLASIIYITLLQCGTVFANDLTPASLVSRWLSALSDFLLTAVIMIPLCKTKHSASQSIFTILKVWVGILLCLVITALSLSTARSHYLSTAADLWRGKAGELYSPLRGVRTAYYVLALGGILTAVVFMGKSISGASSGLGSLKVPLSNPSFPVLLADVIDQMGFPWYNSPRLQRHAARHLRRDKLHVSGAGGGGGVRGAAG